MSSLKSGLASLLRKTERYTKTDMIYLARGSFWLNLATVSNTAVSLALLWVFGNAVEPEVYGQYKYFLSIYGVLALTAVAGINTAVVRSVAQGNEGDLYQGFKIQTLGSLLGSLGAFLGAGYYFMNGNAELGTALIIMGLGLPFMESLDLYAALLNGKRLFHITALATITTQALATFALIGAIIFSQKIIPILIVYFAAWIAVKAFFFWYVLKTQVANTKTSGSLLNIGLHFSAAGILGTVADSLDRIALFHFLGAKEVALYSFAIAPAEQIRGLFKNMSALILPKFSVKTEEELKEGIVRKSLLIGVGGALAGLTYVLLAPSIITFFLPKYLETILYSQVYTLSLVGLLVIPFVVGMSAIPKTKALYIGSIVTPLVTIILTATLIPLYGLWGAFWAIILSRLFGVIVNYLLFMYGPE